MTVSQAVPRVENIGNGVTTTFAFDFKVFKAADLEVTVDGVIVTNYTLTIATPPAYGGSILFAAAPAAAAEIVLKRVLPFDRSTDYQNGGALPEQTLDDDQDAPVMMIQQLAADVDVRLAGVLRVPDGEEVAALPAAGSRASRLVGFDSLGEVTTYPLSGGGGGGGQVPIEFQQAGSPVGGPGSFDTVNFASGATLTDAGGGVLNVAISGGGGGGSAQDAIQRSWMGV